MSDGIEPNEFAVIDTIRSVRRSPTHHIRWIETKAGRELQRAWQCQHYSAEAPTSVTIEWRPVPVVSLL